MKFLDLERDFQKDKREHGPAYNKKKEAITIMMLNVLALT